MLARAKRLEISWDQFKGFFTGQSQRVYQKKKKKEKIKC